MARQYLGLLGISSQPSREWNPYNKIEQNIHRTKITTTTINARIYKNIDVYLQGQTYFSQKYLTLKLFLQGDSWDQNWGGCSFEINGIRNWVAKNSAHNNFYIFKHNSLCLFSIPWKRVLKFKEDRDSTQQQHFIGKANSGVFQTPWTNISAIGIQPPHRMSELNLGSCLKKNKKKKKKNNKQTKRNPPSWEHPPSPQRPPGKIKLKRTEDTRSWNSRSTLIQAGFLR